MTIDWLALLRVAAVTFLGALFVMSVVAGGAVLLASAAHHRSRGESAGMRIPFAYSLFGVAGLVVLYGLYLMVPYFH